MGKYFKTKPEDVIDALTQFYHIHGEKNLDKDVKSTRMPRVVLIDTFHKYASLRLGSSNPVSNI